MRNIRNIILWFEKFDGFKIKIYTNSHSYSIKINIKSLPHLLGLHYSDIKYNSHNLLDFLKSTNDEVIYNLIKNNNFKMLKPVKNRIKYFRYFIENIKEAKLYENTRTNSHLKSKFFLVENYEGKFLQVGIKDQKYNNWYLETFIINKDNLYFKNSNLEEKIEKITRYDPIKKREVPFSFKGEKMEKFFNKDEWKRKQEKKVKELENIINSLTETYKDNPDELIELIKFSSKFKNYSIKNTMLIKAQNKKATYVASFVDFKKMGYLVKKGEKAINIFAPTFSKIVYLDNKYINYNDLKPFEKERVINENIEIKTITKYKIVNVFDVGQTTMPHEDYPKYFGYISLENNDISKKIELLEKYISKKNIDLKYKDLPLGVYGLYSYIDNSIQVSNKLIGINKLSTLSHEFGHAILHNTNSDFKNLPTNIKELQADSVDILMSQYFNFEIQEKRIRHLKNSIQKISREDINNAIYPVINEFNKVLYELEKNSDKLIDNKEINTKNVNLSKNKEISINNNESIELSI